LPAGADFDILVLRKIKNFEIILNSQVQAQREWVRHERKNSRPGAGGHWWRSLKKIEEERIGVGTHERYHEMLKEFRRGYLSAR
jgi:hypothetical protein